MNMNKFQSKIMNYKLFLSRVINNPLVNPRSVTITLTSRCNLKCIMCDHWKLKGQEEPSLERVKNYIDQIKDWGVEEVDLSGGEPFMRKDIFKIINYAYNKGLKINMTTNGTLFTQDSIKELSSLDNLRLQISLDGVNPKTHDSIRGLRETFDTIIKDVKRLKSERDGKVRINATTVIMDKNFKQLIDLYYFTKRVGFDSITYQPVNDSNLFVGAKKRYNPLRIQKKNLKDFDEIIGGLINIKKKDNFIGNSVSFLKGIKDYFHNKPLKKTKCYAGFLIAIITPTNKFWSCKGDFGDLQKQTLKEVWDSKDAKTKRKLIKRCTTPCLYPCFFE